MPTAPTVPNTLSVLVVDDDVVVISLWRSILSRAAPDLRLLTAKDGRVGVTVARSEKPDVILMDLRMPEVDGFEAIRQLKADRETAHIPVIAVTGSVYGCQRVLDAGFAGYLIKPVSPEALLEAISRVVRRRSP